MGMLQCPLVVHASDRPAAGLGKIGGDIRENRSAPCGTAPARPIDLIQPVASRILISRRTAPAYRSASVRLPEHAYDASLDAALTDR